MTDGLHMRMLWQMQPHPLAQAVDEAVKASGISTAAFCRRAGISEATLWKWRHEKSLPRESSRRVVEAEIRALTGEGDSQCAA